MKFIITFLFLSILTSCGSINNSIKEAKYSAYEMIGYEKRDLFKKEVKNVQDNQEDSQEAFEDALKQLQHFYSFDGGKIEKEYNKLKDAYEDSLKESNQLKESITKLNTVANDLFNEWKTEITGISNSELKRKSNKKLQETQRSYKDLYSKLKESEKKMNPLLTKLKDQVTYLKHNLNASAIAGLKTEGARIEKDISRLISEMAQANKEAEDFIKTL